MRSAQCAVFSASVVYIVLAVVCVLTLQPRSPNSHETRSNRRVRGGGDTASPTVTQQWLVTENRLHLILCVLSGVSLYPEFL